jgi:hypothetical protein
MSALIDVYAWVQDWTDSARSVITRRDHLIRLGIGKRRSRAVAPVVDPTPLPSPTPPPVVAQMATRAIAALPPKSNGLTPGAISADGGAHA